MNQGLKKTWCAALEGGHYIQGKLLLRDNNNNCCCLGVLCDLVEPKKWKKVPAIKGYYHQEPCCVFLPSPQLLNKAGVSFQDAQHLSFMNDSGKHFWEIAEWIREHL